MSISLFEISLREIFNFTEVGSVVLACMGGNVKSTVDYDSFFSLSLEEQEISVGIEVIYSSIGYKTLINGVCCVDLYGESLGEFASRISSALKTEVVIGDYIMDVEMATGSYIVYYPDGSFRHAYEIKNGDGVFDVTVAD
ncbi:MULTISPECIES: hypothetical protein [Xanthomonas]|uniref:hypothetical protein n=1 Tax=Xanthomonas TaxID=338 RepID=UPI001ADAB3DF|nr:MULTISPECIES: hypothetical protein [unclassified Xanthomonas]MBO9872942.1 hypothetical protein [Xanthomonas sp. D-93]WNH44839.1 hypothetical protein PG878_20440 [Xanthomonas sp. A6251]